MVPVYIAQPYWERTALKGQPLTGAGGRLRALSNIESKISCSHLPHRQIPPPKSDQSRFLYLQMSQDSDEWSRTVFRVRGLPNAVRTLKDVASLLSPRLADIPSDSIQVYSLATTLFAWESPPSKIATVMFQTPPLLIQQSPKEKEWPIPAKDQPNVGHLTLDRHFLGLTPLNDVDSTHSYEYAA
jgi:hypothetical protein